MTAVDRAAQLIAQLRLQPHPEGGHFRDVFRSAATVKPGDARPAPSALTTIEFPLRRGAAKRTSGSSEAL
jgi:predicted cupin superfamily sugar epimerase